MSTTKPNWRLLALGSLAGFLAAGYGILRQASSDDDLPDFAIASVNDTLISRDLFERALTRMGLERGETDDHAWLLQNLIDDELLVQRGIELGMTQSDNAVRQSIINSLIASITAEADAANPTDDELTQYLTEHGERFSFTASIAVDAWQSDDESAAQAFVAVLRSTGSATPDDKVRMLPDLPSGKLSPAILASYTGPGIAGAAAEMPAGSSAVFARRGRWLIIRVIEKERLAITNLDEIRNAVLVDYRRNLADEKLANYLQGLRQKAAVTAAFP